ncbi:MAG: hypothetical protein JOY59_02290, partial [Candidatus Eremiobacteraeota bacterium]|nr:hypothetical protein [Candidatus Eremiobacteraeota bacterium]
MTPGTDFEELERRDLALEEAARSVVAIAREDQFGREWRPKGIDEVAILLESLGYSTDVIKELWYPSVFALATDVSKLVDKYVTDRERIEAKDEHWFKRACRDYAIGSLYSGPWI